MDLKTFAAREGMSVQRAARMAREGRIPAVKQGRRWLVEPDATLTRFTRRPLSERSAHDFITFLNTGTLDHVTGDRKRRTAQRVRQYWQADNPAGLLREWFRGITLDETRGGAAIVTAAHKGLDDLVLEVRHNKGSWVLQGKELVRRRISDYMAIHNLRVEQVADQAGVPISTVQALVNQGFSPTGNLDANRVVRTLGIHAVRVNAVSEDAV